MDHILFQHSAAIEHRLLLFVLCYYYCPEHLPSSLLADLCPLFLIHGIIDIDFMGPMVILDLIFLKKKMRNTKYFYHFYIPTAMSEDLHAHQYLIFAYFCFKTVLLEMQSRLASNSKSSCLSLQSAGIAYRQEQPCPDCLFAYSYFSR